MKRPRGARSARDRRVLAVIIGVGVACVVIGTRLLQLRRLHEEWATANEAAWRAQFPQEAAGKVGPPDITSWPLFALMVFVIVFLVVILSAAAFSLLRGDDAPHFEDQEIEEQERRRDAAKRLGLGLPGAPPVANTLATREGRDDVRWREDLE